MSLLQEIALNALNKKKNIDLKNSDASDAGASDVVNKGSDDISFSSIRNAINTNGQITGSSVANYLEKAAELNDEIDTVQYGLETDDGEIVKVYVNAEQAEAFGEALKNLLGIEGDIEEAINRLSTEFDIVDVVWPDLDNNDLDDLDQIDLNMALDSVPDEEDDFEEFANAADNDDDLGNEETDKIKKNGKSSKKSMNSSLLQSITAK